jgi:hypothetical protein
VLWGRRVEIAQPPPHWDEPRIILASSDDVKRFRYEILGWCSRQSEMRTGLNSSLNFIYRVGESIGNVRSGAKQSEECLSQEGLRHEPNVTRGAIPQHGERRRVNCSDQVGVRRQPSQHFHEQLVCISPSGRLILARTSKNSNQLLSSQFLVLHESDDPRWRNRAEGLGPLK